MNKPKQPPNAENNRPKQVQTNKYVNKSLRQRSDYINMRPTYGYRNQPIFHISHGCGQNNLRIWRDFPWDLLFHEKTPFIWNDLDSLELIESNEFEKAERNLSENFPQYKI